LCHWAIASYHRRLVAMATLVHTIDDKQIEL